MQSNKKIVVGIDLHKKTCAPSNNKTMPPKKRTTKKPKKLVAATLAPAVSASKKTEKKQTKSAATPAKKQKKEYIDVNALDDNGDEVQQNGGILKPNMHTFLHIQKKFLRLKIQLHKVPPQLINLDMKADKFHVDTLQYTRKYQAEYVAQKLSDTHISLVNHIMVVFL